MAGSKDELPMRRRSWSKPVLTSASIKEITAGTIVSGVGDSGTMTMSPSDARLKSDVRRVGTSQSGIPIFQFRYIWGDQVYLGAMAQDLLTSNPDAVHLDAIGGFYVVDCSRIDVDFAAVV